MFDFGFDSYLEFGWPADEESSLGIVEERKKSR
jgi:hypothetical protein